MLFRHRRSGCHIDTVELEVSEQKNLPESSELSLFIILFYHRSIFLTLGVKFATTSIGRT